jgi:ribosomal protein S18 acetylase RimI-like enzyme
MDVRTAAPSDFEALYQIGLATPELRVSQTEQFMDPDEFAYAIVNPLAVFLVAQTESEITGFIYAHAKDANKPFQNRYACLVYLAVLPGFRRLGIARQLFVRCEERLRELGITHIYSWANSEGDLGIVHFMEQQQFLRGHQYVWMDKKL